MPADAAFFGKPEVKNYFSMLGLTPRRRSTGRLMDGDEIMIGDVTFKVIHTPGHTPGGMCLYNAPDLFTGDTLFVGGLGRTDFPGGSHQELLTSIRDQAAGSACRDGGLAGSWLWRQPFDHRRGNTLESLFLGTGRIASQTCPESMANCGIVS